MSKRRYPDTAAKRRIAPSEGPTRTDLCKDLADAVTKPEFDLTLLDELPYHTVCQYLETGEYQVYHYIGIGQVHSKDAMIAFGDERVQSWGKVDKILEIAARSGVRLVVFEFMLPPEGTDLSPITPRALDNAIKGSVNAVVLTNLPVHPIQFNQFKQFNDEFYACLSAGDSIESATQNGRSALQLDTMIEDAAAFGWFTVITGPAAGVSLVAKATCSCSSSNRRGSTSRRHARRSRWTPKIGTRWSGRGCGGSRPPSRSPRANRFTWSSTRSPICWPACWPRGAGPASGRSPSAMHSKRS
jgi:predicted RNase H-like HicB family nuclease